MVVDRQVHIFPAPAGLALADPAAGDPVTDPIELAELLDVDVDDLAGRGAFIAADRLGRLESGKPIEAQPFEDAADGGRRNPDFRGDLLAGVVLPRKASTLSQAAGPVWLGDERGRDERSCKPATPSARNRATHLATVFGVAWNARAAAAFDEPPSITLRAIASRPLGVTEAFL